MGRRKSALTENDDTTNVVELVHKQEQENKKPILQTQLDVLTSKLLTNIEDREVLIRYVAGTWFVYQNGHWRASTEEDRQNIVYILAEICEEVGVVYAKSEKVIWTHLSAVREFAVSKNMFDAKPIVAVKNGSVDIETGKRLKHDPEHYTTRYVDITYDPDAQCPEWLQMLDNVFGDRTPEGRAALINLMQEWFGVALAGGNTKRTPRALRKGLFLYGPPRTGKSTILDTLKYMLGSDKIVTSPPGHIVRAFGLDAFIGAAGWICEEVDGTNKAIDPSRIKALITGETLTVQRKYLRDALLDFTGPVCWAGNSQPNFPESSGAIYDRMFIISLARSFTEAEAKKAFGKLKPIEWLIDKDVMPGIFVWALKGYARLIERGKFEQPQELEGAGQEWRATNDAVYAFLSECCEIRENTYNTASVLTWAASAYIKANGDMKITHAKLRRDIRSVLPEKWPDVKINERLYQDDGSRVYVYKGLALNKTGLAYLKQAERDSDIAQDENLKPNMPLIGT